MQVLEQFPVISRVDQTARKKRSKQVDIMGVLSEKRGDAFHNLFCRADGVLFHLVFRHLQGLQIANIAGAWNENDDHQDEGEKNPQMK